MTCTADGTSPASKLAATWHPMPAPANAWALLWAFIVATCTT